jgi:hypothetical protein
MTTEPNRPTTDVFGMKLPVIADLGDGWFLVAHPNGAAIAKIDFICVLWIESTETHEDLSDSPVPEAIRSKAVEAFETFAWPLVRGEFPG